MDRNVIANGPLVIGGQGYDYERIERIGDRPGPARRERKLRVTVHVDTSYDFQSKAKVEVWDGNRWNEVVKRIGGSPDLSELPGLSNYLGVPKAGDIAKAETAVGRFVDTLVAEAGAVIF